MMSPFLCEQQRCLAAATKAIGRCTGAAAPSGRVFPVGTRAAGTTGRIAVAIGPTARLGVPPAMAGMPVAVGRIEVVTAWLEHEVIRPSTDDNAATVWRCAGATARAGWIFPVRSGTTPRTGRI